jgi:protease-4
MRTLGKILLGILAVVGFFTIVIFVSGLYALFRLEGGGTRPLPMSSRAVLALNLDDHFVEGSTGRRLEGLGLRSFVSFEDALLAIRHAKTDTRIVALKANLSQHNLGIAQIQELRDAVADFRTSGKPAYLFSETIGEGEGALPAYYLAAAFGDIWVQPSGSVGIAGIGTEEFFLKKFLDRIGVKGSFLQRKEYKSAPEMFTNTGMSAANREAMTALVGSWYDQMTAGIAADRKIEVDAVKAMVDDGPLLATEARDKHLIDHVGYRDEFDAAVKSALKNATTIDFKRYVNAIDKSTATVKRVALIHAVGEIDRSTGSDRLFGGATGIHSAEMVKAIRKAADDKSIDAIMLRIDSPGGDYVASDIIWREIARAKEKKKPVIVSMGDTAASGGYFIAMNSDRIFADPGTITGSIGVFMGKIVVGDALAKLDINHDRVTFGDSAGMFSATSDFSPRDLARLNHMLDATYADFTGKAAQGRAKSPAEIEAVAKGRVWSGADALKVGLVDELGGFLNATDYIKKRLGVKPGDAIAFVDLPAAEEPWAAFFKALGDDEMPSKIASIMHTLAWVSEHFSGLMSEMQAAEAPGVRVYAPGLGVN